MQAYTSFAEVYDIFMDNIPYEEWADYLDEMLKEYHIPNNMVLELGCGTGNMTELLASKGYDMIGVDNSEVMLEIAMEKRQKSGHDILYLLQDMQAFELYGTVGGIVSVCDSINYIYTYVCLCMFAVHSRGSFPLEQELHGLRLEALGFSEICRCVSAL